MRIGISGTHGVGKSTLAEALRGRLPGHVVADEPYDVLTELGHEFDFPPSADDLHVLTEFTIRSLGGAPRLPAVIFDRTPLDYLAYLAAGGAAPADFADAPRLRKAFAGLDVLLVIPVSAVADLRLPPPALPRLRRAANDALLALVYDDPLEAWSDLPIVEMDAPLAGRLDQALRALRQVAVTNSAVCP